MRRRAIGAAALVVVVAASLAATAGAGSKAVERTAVNCRTGTLNIGLLTVLTGPAAFLGQDQKAWALLAANRIGRQLGLRIRIIDFDTTLDSAVAVTQAQKLVGNRNIVAAIGPATSGGARAATKTLGDAGVTHVTPSATAVDLTKGANPAGGPFFFRVVVDDSLQGTLDAKYIAGKLNAKKVTVIDAQEPYSVGLANIVERVLERAGVTVQRQSVTNNTTDFSSNVTRIPSDTDVVFTPFQVAANANQVAVLLKEQGKRAVVFGGDGTADPAFKVPGSYVSLFAPDISNTPIFRAWQAANPGKSTTPFGIPAYGAVQTIAYAAKRACAKKSQYTRASLRAKMKAGPIPNWILGGTFRFSTKTNDPLNGGYWLYQVQSDGTQKQVAKLG
jgi:branched-chain amino acid transport system substrate-binding protein